MTELDELIERVARGERHAVARALRIVDDHPEVGRTLAYRLHDHRRGAEVIGLTGNPGAGKSTVADCLITLLRKAGKKVAVLAVDPSSPFSGGAILGDRIRMSQHSSDDGVFIRSLATRGALGGLSSATFDSVRVLDAAGFDVVLVETVGVGQDEVDIARLAETTIVVLVPGMGDDVQAIKAGLLEIADVFLINKADREGVPALEKSLRQMQSLAPEHGSWEPPIVRAVALRGEGLEELLKVVTLHQEHARSPSGRDRAVSRANDMFDRLLDAALVERGRGRLAKPLVLARQRLRAAGADPYAEVLALLEAPELS
jgi:LAO/AO transport system kinase